jgi:hypothetical protein
MTLSPQIRIVALVGLVAALGLGASVMLFSKGGSKTETLSLTTRAAVTTAVTTPSKPHVTPTKTPAKAHTRTHTRVHTATGHHVKAPAKAHKPAVFRGNPVYANLPAALQWQLAHHKVVIVSVYNPSSDVDSISVAEAHQGAVDAKVGFLLVSVLDNKVAGLLTALLPGGGLLPDPGVLVYRAPGDIALRLDGFNDRSTVAQAATNVLNGESGPVTVSTPTATVDPAAAAAAAAAAATAAASSSGSTSP